MLPSLLLLLSPGTRAPDLPFAAPQPVLLVNFWASWCAPCLEELPLLDALQRRLERDAVKAAVVTVNIDARRRPAEAVVERLELGLPVHYDPDGAVVALFEPKAMPATYLLDQGVVEQVWIGGLEPAAIEAIELSLRERSTP